MVRTLFFCAALGLSFGACNSSKPKADATATTNSSALDSVTTAVDNAHNSENALDWDGVYEATLPCADCPGIKTQLTLNPDKTFLLHREYLEKNTNTEDKGTFMWHNQGAVVHLQGKDTDLKLKVGENQLFLLDSAGEINQGPQKEAYTFIKK